VESGRYPCHEEDGVMPHEILCKADIPYIVWMIIMIIRADADDCALCLHGAGQ
jgi:hypothetical protein